MVLNLRRLNGDAIHGIEVRLIYDLSDWPLHRFYIPSRQWYNTIWNSNFYFIVGCPVRQNFTDGGLDCSPCINGNHPYSDFREAWKACGTVPGCSKIMRIVDPKGNWQFFLRSENSKENAYARHHYVNYWCPGIFYLMRSIEYECFCLIDNLAARYTYIAYVIFDYRPAL